MLLTSQVRFNFSIDNVNINKTKRTFSPKPPDKTRNAIKMLEIC